MTSAWEFVLGAFAIILAVGIWVFREHSPDDIKAYFKSRAGRGAIKSAGLAIGVLFLALAVSLLTGCQGTYFNDASIYAGLERTKNDNPQCEQGDPDDRWGSNLGGRLNTYRSDDERMEANLVYTHHSCFIGADDKSYDAFGIQLEYEVWRR